MNDIMKVYETTIKEKDAKHTEKNTDIFFHTLFTAASFPITITKWQHWNEPKMTFTNVIKMKTFLKNRQI